MAATESSQVTAAKGEGFDGKGVAALRDVELVMRATLTASNEMALYSRTQFGPGTKAARQAQWVLGWADFAAASAQVSDEAGPAIAARWDAVNARPKVAGLNRFLAARLSRPSR